MKKIIIGCLLAVFGIAYWLFPTKEAYFKSENIYKLCIQYPKISKILGCDRYYSSKFKSYKYISNKDEKSLEEKMGIRKIPINLSKEINPGTSVKVLNFSNSKLNLESFSESYTAGPEYIYQTKDAYIIFGPDTRKFFILKNGFYAPMGRGNAMKTMLPNLLDKEDIIYDEKNGKMYVNTNNIDLTDIKDKVIYFVGDSGIYHLIMEAAPGLLLVKDKNYKLNIAKNIKHNMGLIKALGNYKTVLAKPYTHKKIKELIIPSPLLENNAHFPNIELTNSLIEKLKTSLSESTKVKPLGKKIYISRSDARRRRVLNEEELIKQLRKRGFNIVIPGKYNLADQAKLFEKAEVIVGPHGMGLTNMLFSNNLKIVIELFSDTWCPNCYLRTAQVRGAKSYYALFHDAENKDTKYSDFQVNIPGILRILDSNNNAIN